MSDSLLLKWGTVKGWHFESEDAEAFSLIKKYMKDMSGGGCMADHPGETSKHLLCEIIDKIDGEIHNDWTGKMMTKEEAKAYVMDYGKD
jgi:hypothetical protein